MKASTSAGSTTAIIRSCDSLMRISSGASVESRSGTRSSSTCMPPSPARRELGGGARETGAAEVLDAGDEAGGEDLERALDEQLLHEGVADLDARPLGGTIRVEGLGRQHGDAADAVAAGAGAVQDDLVAGARRLGEVQVLVAQHADAERVDERVAEVGLVEDGLTADVGQPEHVAVAADAGHDPRQHAVGVGGVERAEAQRVHHGNRARAHREDVADDAADAGRRTLVGLDVGRVVVRLDLEGDRIALADVDDAGVLADAGEGLAERRLLRDLGELLEVHLGGLVGAVLAPHDGVHRQLRAGRDDGRGSRGSGRTRRP